MVHTRKVTLTYQKLKHYLRLPNGGVKSAKGLVMSTSSVQRRSDWIGTHATTMMLVIGVLGSTKPITKMLPTKIRGEPRN